ncbi:MAG TPA: pyrroloquinoline quinone biosynthesis peptide chaperone PqqD [Candidatus Eremiobacteraceae bacterium]|nr:pyrroloquinoline quinone biosynthesis peptide chaperone PqqD [Candidatus Eremiobacteraceae bacterium]
MTDVDMTMIPRLLPGVRMRALDDGASVLLVPEGVVRLTATGAAIVESIDGRRDVARIVALMHERFDASGADVETDVADLLGSLAQRTWIELVR